MSEQELQLLITIDDPGEPPEEDIFNHLPDAKVTFCQGDWTCTLSKFDGHDE